MFPVPMKKIPANRLATSDPATVLCVEVQIAPLLVATNIRAKIGFNKNRVFQERIPQQASGGVYEAFKISVWVGGYFEK